MDLKTLLDQAVADSAAYEDAAAKVVTDQKQLSDDQTVAQGKANTAQGSIKAGIQALTDELAKLPAVTQ